MPRCRICGHIVDDRHYCHSIGSIVPLADLAIQLDNQYASSDPVVAGYKEFEQLVRRALGTQKSITLGNVEFWVDEEGPWAGQLSYSCPTPRWIGVAEALTKALSGVM